MTILNACTKKSGNLLKAPRKMFYFKQFNISAVFCLLIVNMEKQLHFKQFSLVNKVKRVQVLPCITNNSIKQVIYLRIIKCQTVLFQTIQFSISTQFSSIWPIDRTLSGATTPGQSGSGRTVIKGVLNIPQSSNITGA